MINVILFILCFIGNVPSHPYVISFEKSSCGIPNAIPSFEVRNRILDSTYVDSTLSIKIEVLANCGIGTTNNVQLLGDTLELIYGVNFYPKYGPVEEDGGYSSDFTFCDCKFTLSYLIGNLAAKDYHIKIKEVGSSDQVEIIEKSPYKYRSTIYPDGLTVEEYKKKLVQNLDREKEIMDSILLRLNAIVRLKDEDIANEKVLAESIDGYIQLENEFMKYKYQYFGLFISEMLGAEVVKMEAEEFQVYMKNELVKRDVFIDQINKRGIDFWKEVDKRNRAILIHKAPTEK